MVKLVHPNQLRVLVVSVLLLASFSVCCSVLAQSSSNKSEDETYISLKHAVGFAKQIEQDLAGKGARVALVFRMGQLPEKMPKGIRYGHGSFWVYQRIRDVSGKESLGYTSNNLYSDVDNPSKSYLKVDFPIDFTRPSKVASVGIIIPKPELQERILKLMSSENYIALHRENYSLISNPHDKRYQNCNEFMLDVIAAALWDTNDISRIKNNLSVHFEPSKVNVGPLKRLFAPVFREDVKTKDHKRSIATTTFASLAKFLDENGYSQEVYELSYAIN